jgi:hypothetical protein
LALLPPPPPPPQPPPRSRQQWSTAGWFRRTAHMRPDEPNRQASLAQRTPARSTGADRPSGTDMNRVAAARTTGCGVLPQIRTRHHQAHRPQPHPHTRAPEPVWREGLGSQLGAVLGGKAEPAGGCDGGGGTARSRPCGKCRPPAQKPPTSGSAGGLGGDSSWGAGHGGDVGRVDRQ